MKNTNNKLILREILHLSMPIIIQGVIFAFVPLIDSLYIGNLANTKYLTAALNAVSQLLYLIQTIVGGFIAGLGVYFAKAVGQKNQNKIAGIFYYKLFWSFVLGGIFLTLALSLNIELTKFWINQNDQNISLTTNAVKDYGPLVYLSQFIGFVVLSIVSSSQESKNTKLVLYISFVPILINASLNYPFIYSFDLGLKGAAYTTLIARVVELLVWIIILFYTKPDYIKWKTVSWKDPFFWRIIPKVFLWTFNSLLVTSAFVFYIQIISTISIGASSSLNIAGIFAQVVNAIMNAINMAAYIYLMNKMGQNEVKEKNNTLIYQETIYITKIMFLVGLIGGALLSAISPLMFVIYQKIDFATNFQAIIMLFAISSTLAINLGLSVLITYLKGRGYAKIIIIFDGFFGWVLTVPITYVLSRYAFPSVDYGYIYWIATILVIFKIPLVTYWFIKTKNKLITS